MSEEVKHGLLNEHPEIEDHNNDHPHEEHHASNLSGDLCGAVHEIPQENAEEIKEVEQPQSKNLQLGIIFMLITTILITIAHFFGKMVIILLFNHNNSWYTVIQINIFI